MSYFKKGQLVDQYGFVAANTSIEEMRVAEPTLVVGHTFSGQTIDENFWIHSGTNGATVNLTDIPGSVVLNTGDQSDGYSLLKSKHYARYIPGSAMKFRCQVRLAEGGIAGNVRQWGVFDETDGAFFRLNGTTFEACTMNDGAVTVAATLASPSVNLASYEIIYINGRVTFNIANASVATKSASTEPWTSNIHLPIRFENMNTGISVSRIIEVRVAYISALGKSFTDPIYYHFTGSENTVVLKRGPGKIHRVIINSSGGSSFSLIDSYNGITPVITSTDTIQPISVEYMCPFNNGLTLKTVGNGVDVTIIYE